ncbi:hypothetical protein V1523DRAFT_402289 [Lipomyces doorenjongii]
MARLRARSTSLFSHGSPLTSPVADTPAFPPSSSDLPNGIDPRVRAMALQSYIQKPASTLSTSDSSTDRETSSPAPSADRADDSLKKPVDHDPIDPKEIPPELESIINVINAQQSRCYYEGRFVFLKDLDADGKAPADREWRDVYGQLVGTVFSIWESSELERAAAAAGASSSASASNSPVKPTYINIADASLRLIESLPASNGAPPITNVIALSTTFKNRFLLQFGSRSTMLLWSSALRLALFESVSLQEAYTGALLAGKGSKLNGIRLLLQETKFKHQDWVVVRFGAGMPWTRCWAVITPAGYKKKKQNKTGRIDFFETKKAKQRKQQPLATISAAKAVYAVYPESSLLINNSTLLKIAGTIAVHDDSGKGAPRDGFIFVMPEIHPGVYGFETLIRFLIPTLDSFSLYGRPQRFNADKFDIRSIMFGLPDPPSTRYLDLADVYDISIDHPFDDWKEDTWRSALKHAIVQKVATGTRHILRTLPSEPEHSTPPLPQGEINGLGNKLHTINLSIRRAAPSAPRSVRQSDKLRFEDTTAPTLPAIPVEYVDPNQGRLGDDIQESAIDTYASDIVDSYGYASTDQGSNDEEEFPPRRTSQYAPDFQQSYDEYREDIPRSPSSKHLNLHVQQSRRPIHSQAVHFRDTSPQPQSQPLQQQQSPESPRRVARKPLPGSRLFPSAFIPRSSSRPRQP